MLVVPVCPMASRTVPVRVWVPFGTGVVPAAFVTHGMLTGPRDAVVWLLISLPSTLSVKTFEAPVVPSAHRTTQTVPLTVALAFGWVMKALTGL